MNPRLLLTFGHPLLLDVGDQKGAGGSGAGGAGASGADSSGKAKEPPQTITVKYSDGSTRQEPIEEAAKKIANFDRLLKEKEQAIRTEADEATDLKAEKKAQEKLDAYFAELKEKNPELHNQLFPGKDTGGKGAAPAKAKPEPKAEPLQLDIPKVDDVDFTDEDQTREAFGKLVNAFAKLAQGQTATREQLQNVSALAEKLGDFDPSALDGKVDTQVADALKKYGPQMIKHVRDGIKYKENLQKETQAAREQIHSLVEKRYPVMDEGSKEQMQNIIYRDSLLLRNLANNARMDAQKRKAQDSSVEVPAEVPLARIIADEEERLSNTIMGVAIALARAHERGLSSLGVVPEPAKAAEPEKKYKTPQEAADAYRSGERL